MASTSDTELNINTTVHDTNTKNLDACCRTCLRDVQGDDNMYDVFQDGSHQFDIPRIIYLCTTIEVS